MNKEELTQEDLKTFISVTNGPLCHQIYHGYIQVLSNKHLDRSIWVRLMITSIPTHDPTTGDEIKYFEEYTLPPKSSRDLDCDVPGPTNQRFFWTPVEAKFV